MIPQEYLLNQKNKKTFDRSQKEGKILPRCHGSDLLLNTAARSLKTSTDNLCGSLERTKRSEKGIEKEVYKKD